jgi:hypothetical protein
VSDEPASSLLEYADAVKSVNHLTTVQQHVGCIRPEHVD